MQAVRDMAIQRIDDIEQRGFVAEAIDPFFVGKRHHQVCFVLKTVDYSIGPAVTDALIIEGRYHGGNGHRPDSTR